MTRHFMDLTGALADLLAAGEVRSDDRVLFGDDDADVWTTARPGEAVDGFSRDAGSVAELIGNLREVEYEDEHGGIEVRRFFA